VRQVLIDTDPGIDDALALLLAWGSPEIEVVAVTTVAGNVPLVRATENVFRLLDARRPVPRPVVAAGAAAPLARPLTTATRYHGEDGLGDLGDWPPVRATPGPASAAETIADIARRLGAALTVVALGPLTNLALALASDPAAVGGVGRVVSMGGAVDVPGNVTPTAEFNMSVDPEAAARVFDVGLRLDLVPLDATRQARLARVDLERSLAAFPDPLAARIAAFTAPAFRREGGATMTPHDALAVAAAVDPTLVEWEAVRLAIGPGGETRRLPGVPTCRVARRVDRDRFVRLLLSRLCPSPACPGS
jgi:inosine-uridine nucleoside N-ribohydrolase